MITLNLNRRYTVVDMKILVLFYCSHWYLELKTTNVSETFGLSIEIKLYLIACSAVTGNDKDFLR
jgi:hypothetical protein